LAICLKVIGHLSRRGVAGRPQKSRSELLSWKQSDHH
jgi:hypothetical protein